MTMPFAERERCRKLRIRSKRGEYLSQEEINFLESCWKQWPDEYRAIGREAFIETAPFGSRLDKGEKAGE